jgi:hypothetical protein
MDPNKTLDGLIALAQEIDEDEDEKLGIVAMAETAQALAGDFLNLNEWLGKGGFLPAAWQPKGTTEEAKAAARAWLKDTNTRSDDRMVESLAALLMGWRTAKRPKGPTDVVFRFFTVGGRCLALFPGLPGTRDKATCESYEHLGQHVSADYVRCLEITRPAKPKEYASLQRELEGMGYNLNVLKRAPKKTRRP